MAFHGKYWSCSNFADWVRGTPKLEFGTSEEWDDWHQLAEKKPIRYWIAEELLGHIQDFITWPGRKIYDLKYYINNRWVTRTHALTAHRRDIKPGEWCDVGNRFLPCLFNELVDFVEIELAWWNIAWTDKETRAKYNAPFWATGWFRWRTWRCKQAGLDNLEWQRKLTYDTEYSGTNIPADKVNKLTPQAVNAQEMLDLYTWWTEVRPARPEPMDASGWTAICEARRVKREASGKRESFFSSLRDETPAEKKATKKAMDMMHKMEAAYEKEDEDMMIRLIKVRQGLWT
jgi:hypothetical protein